MFAIYHTTCILAARIHPNPTKIPTTTSSAPTRDTTCSDQSRDMLSIDSWTKVSLAILSDSYLMLEAGGTVPGLTTEHVSQDLVMVQRRKASRQAHVYCGLSYKGRYNLRQEPDIIHGPLIRVI
jgi:hypothetical protein